MGMAEDISTLTRALHLERDHEAGIFPRGGAKYAQFRKLAKFGMLECTGEVGCDLDGIVEGDVVEWRLTEQGRAWITQREEEAEAHQRALLAEEERDAQAEAQERCAS